MRKSIAFAAVSAFASVLLLNNFCMERAWFIRPTSIWDMKLTANRKGTRGAAGDRGEEPEHYRRVLEDFLDGR